MSKLWIIGDSFWDRNCITDTNGVTKTFTDPIADGTWIDTFVSNCELDFNWGSNTWCISGASNDWLAYGLDCITTDSRFDMDNDTVMLGFTRTDRRVARRNADKGFITTLGWENIRQQRGTTVSQLSTMSMLYESLYINQDREMYNNFIQTREWNPAMLKTEIKYSIENLDLDWLHYLQCSMLDGAISKAKSRGVNIIPHRGCMYLYTEDEIQLKDSKYNWHNTEIFDVPSFQIGLDADRQERMRTENIDENELPMEQRWHNKYNSHMSPVGTKAYGDAFSNWWNNRG
tara:strand:- start:164 stop:1027 length:864 start_codon:yes stop_codon:yes gene_type:complete